MISVVGIGPGNIFYTTVIAIKIISEADIIIGGKRNIDAVNEILVQGEIDSKEIFILGSNFGEMKSYILENIDKKICVIASGDPNLYGIANYIERNFEKLTDVEVHSGISSVQYLFSRIKINMNDLYITSCHGRLPDFDSIFGHEKVAILTDAEIGPKEIANEVKKRGYNYLFYVGENLSYDDECIYSGLPDDILKKDEYGLSVVVLIKRKVE